MRQVTHRESDAILGAMRQVALAGGHALTHTDTASIQIAKFAGAKVYVVGSSQQKLEQAKALGVADSIEIHQGLFVDIFSTLEWRCPRFAFVHIDANIYQGTLEACHAGEVVLLAVATAHRARDTAALPPLRRGKNLPQSADVQ